MDNMTNDQKAKLFARLATIGCVLGHYYVGFEGKTCSQMQTDDKERAMQECAWVWDTRKREFIKHPPYGTDLTTLRPK